MGWAWKQGRKLPVDTNASVDSAGARNKQQRPRTPSTAKCSGSSHRAETSTAGRRTAQSDRYGDALDGTNADTDRIGGLRGRLPMGHDRHGNSRFPAIAENE